MTSMEWSDVAHACPGATLSKEDGSQVVRVPDQNMCDALAQYKLGKPELLQVKTRDGFAMEAMMIKPPDFDPTKKYPVLEFTYSGPHAPQVRNAWGGAAYMWHQLMAQKGYIIWICDNRTASGKGVEAAWPAYKNLGDWELRDLEDGLAWLKNQPYIDGSRIGLWGWSYGGYMTSYALTHSQSFKMGIAGGTVADWRNYDSVYTERYMLMPQNNLDGYKKSSPVTAAKDLHGKLLLIHGAIDDNVHLANTIQFVYELQKAGKQFQLMLYPKSRHARSLRDLSRAGRAVCATGKACPASSSRSFETFCSAAGWPAGSRGFAAATAASTGWSRFPARAARCVRVAAAAGWPSAPPTCSITCSPTCPCGSGC